MIDGEINPMAYNCHSFAWEESQGDPLDIRNASLVKSGVIKWDNNPDDNMQGFTQLSSDDPNQSGDRVIYYVDANNNGRYEQGEFIAHSAVVYQVDSQGYTKLVISKMGQSGISINHPCAPGFYEDVTIDVIMHNGSKEIKRVNTSRAYFRYTGKGIPPMIKISPNETR